MHARTHKRCKFTAPSEPNRLLYSARRIPREKRSTGSRHLSLSLLLRPSESYTQRLLSHDASDDHSTSYVICSCRRPSQLPLVASDRLRSLSFVPSLLSSTISPKSSPSILIQLPPSSSCASMPSQQPDSHTLRMPAIANGGDGWQERARDTQHQSHQKSGENPTSSGPSGLNPLSSQPNIDSAVPLLARGGLGWHERAALVARSTNPSSSKQPSSPTRQYAASPTSPNYHVEWPQNQHDTSHQLEHNLTSPSQGES